MSDLYLNRLPEAAVARWRTEVRKRLRGHRLERISIEHDGDFDAVVEVTLNYGGFEGVHRTVRTPFTYRERPGSGRQKQTLVEIGFAVDAAICYAEGR